MFDTKTVVFSFVVTNILITLFIALLWYQNRRRYAGLSLWLIDYILQAVGLLLSLLRGVVSDIVSIIIGNTLMMIGILIMLRGLESFVGKPRSQTHNFLLLTGFVCFMLYFTFVQPDISTRSVLITIIIMLLTLQCGWLMLRRVEPTLHSITRDVGLVFFLYALAAFLRIIILLRTPLPATINFFESPALQVMFLLINQMLGITLTFALILIVTRRLALDVQTQEQKYKSLYASMLEGVVLHEVIYDAGHHAVDYRILDVNPTYERMFGLTREQAIGQKASELYGAGKLPYLDVYTKVAATPQATSFETYFWPLDKHFSISFFSPGRGQFAAVLADVTERKRVEQEREKLIRELQETLARVKTLTGLLPICASCKKIRDDKGYWNQIEEYIRDHSEADFSHGICPDCMKKLYPDLGD